MRTRHTHRTGFALVSTMLLIAVAGLLLVGFARLSVNKSVEVIHQIHKLQTRWAVDSSERLIFGGIDELLSEQVEQVASETARPPGISIAQVTDRFEFGDVVLEALVSDESAKLDLNLIGSRRGDRGIRDSVEQICPEGNPFLELVPKIRRRDAKDNEFVSWDQVFQDKAGAPLHPSELIRLSRHLTCWGKKIHLSTASDEVLAEATGIAIGNASSQRVVALRRQSPTASVSNFLKELALPRNQSDRLAAILSQGSISQSIWIKATHRRSGSESYWFVIREGFIIDRGSQTAAFRFQTFTW